MKKFYSKAVKMVSAVPPAEFACFWQGNIFFKGTNSKGESTGIYDELQLCRILDIKYISQLKNIVAGDFTLLLRN